MVPRTWYLATVLHYMGLTNNQPLWAVALLSRSVNAEGHIETRWEWVENLSWDEAQKLQERVKPSLVRTSSGELRRALTNA